MSQERTQPTFVNYIRKHWANKLELWVKGALEGLDHSKAYTNAHIEAFHAVLKEFDLKGRKRLKGRSLDWLVCQLLTSVIGRYKCARLPSRPAPLAPPHSAMAALLLNLAAFLILAHHPLGRPLFSGPSVSPSSSV